MNMYKNYIHQDNIQFENTPTDEQIFITVVKLKNNKNAGETSTTVEMLKMGGSILQIHIIDLIKDMWQDDSYRQIAILK